MKLSDFYDSKKVPVTSVNNKIGDVVLTASDVNAISQSQIGVTVPILRNGIIPDSELPNYAKLVNGKIVYSNIPYTSQLNLGGIQLGSGFENVGHGVVNAVGIISRQQKQQKVDIIKNDGQGNLILADDGTYKKISNDLKSSFQFNYMDDNYDVFFENVLPIVGVRSNNLNYYNIDNDIRIQGNYTILNMRRFLIIQQQSDLNGNWKVYFSCARKELENNNDTNIDVKYKKLALKKALIYG